MLITWNGNKPVKETLCSLRTISAFRNMITWEKRSQNVSLTFYIWGICGPERLAGLPKATQQKTSQA